MVKYARKQHRAREAPAKRPTSPSQPVQRPVHSTINMASMTPETIIRLQSVMGNQSLQRFLAQRDTDTVETDNDAVEAQQEWDKHRGIHYHFQFKGSKTPFEHYLEVRPAYLAAGISNPAKYIVDNIISVSFFGHKTSAHKDLQAPLQQAEAALKAQQFDAKSIYSFASFVPRFIRGSTKLSEHAKGRAIDINPDRNPRITKQEDFRVIQAVTGIHLGQGQSAEVMRKANETFKSTFKQAWIDAKQKQLDQLKLEDKLTPDMRNQMRDLKILLDAVKRRRIDLNGYAATGFLNLDQALIDALVAAKFKWGGGFKATKDFMHFELP